MRQFLHILCMITFLMSSSTMFAASGPQTVSDDAPVQEFSEKEQEAIALCIQKFEELAQAIATEKEPENYQAREKKFHDLADLFFRLMDCCLKQRGFVFSCYNIIWTAFGDIEQCKKSYLNFIPEYHRHGVSLDFAGCWRALEACQKALEEYKNRGKSLWELADDVVGDDHAY